MLLEFVNRVDVITPKGKGSIWFVTQFGHETSLVFCVIHENGQIWEWLPKDLQVTNNETFGRIFSPFNNKP